MSSRDLSTASPSASKSRSQRSAIRRLGFFLAATSVITLALMSVSVWAATLYDSFTDGDFTSSPVWGGNTANWQIVANSDAAAGATGSNTLRLNAPATSQTDYLSSQIGTWGTSQEWGVWIGRRGQAFTGANQQYFWLYANESTLNNGTVDGYRIAIGDDTGGDEIRLEYVVNGTLSATVITSAPIANGLTDIGFLVRVTRTSLGGWELFTSTLPTVNGTGAIATAIPDSTNASISQGTATHNILVPADNGYIGVAALHSTGAGAIVGAEFDQIYFTQAGGGGGTPSIAISAANPSAGNINQNSTNNIIGSIQLDVTTASATLTGLTVTTAGTYQTSDIQTNGFKFWINSTNNLSGATQLGASQAVVASGGTVAVSGLSTSIASGATRFLLVTSDIAYNAVAGRTISLTSTPFSNIPFSTGTKTGTDPVAASNAQTIATVTPSIAISQAGPAAGNVSKGSAKNSVYQLSLAVTSNATDFTGLTVTTAGTYGPSDITTNTFKIWYNTSNNLGTATQLGSSQAVVSSGGSVTFSSLSQKIDVGATGFVWVTVDIDSAASVNNTISITSTTFSNITFSAGSKTGTDPAAAGGTQTIADLTVASDFFRSNVSSGSWATAATWESSHDGSTNWITSTLSPDNNANAITIRNGHTVTVGTNVSTDQTTVDAGGQITVNSGITLTIADGTGTDLVVNGIVASAGTITPTGTISFGGGGKYQHNFTTAAGIIPTATWDGNSTVEILGYTSNTSVPAGIGQSFGNFTWNCSSQTGNLSFAGASLSASGTLTMTSTNTGSVRFGAGTNGVWTLGSFTQTGGTIDLSSGAGNGTLRVAGTFNQSGGIITESGSGTTNTIEFDGTLNQSVTLGTVNNTISYLINNAAGVTLGSSLNVNANLTFTTGNITTAANTVLVASAGTLTHTSGHVVGNLQKAFAATGSKTFEVGTANGYSPLDVNVTAGTFPSTFTVKATQGAAPVVDTTKSLQRYWTLTEGGDITVDLTFHYLDPTDIPGTSTEANYRIIRVSGGTAISFLNSCPSGSSCVDFANNQATVKSVSNFSDWTLGEPAAPTAVTMTGFKATAFNDGVMIEWQSGYEANNLGYQLYKLENGQRTRVTPSLIAGSALVRGGMHQSGFSYGWFDTGGSVGTQYMLEAIDLNGAVDTFAPQYAAHGGNRNAPKRSRSVLLTQMAGTGSGQAAQRGWAPAPAPAPAPDLQSAGTRKPAAQSLATQQWVAAQPGVKFQVRQTGWYRVNQQQLIAAGMDPNADATLLQLYVNGEEQALRISGDSAKSGLPDSVEFYGSGQDALTTDSRTYYLVSGTHPGLRISAKPDSKSRGETTQPDSKGLDFTYTVESKERGTYLPGLLNGDGNNIFGQIVTSAPANQTVTLHNVNGNTQASAQLQVIMQGFTTLGHQIQVQLNGTYVGTVNFNGSLNQSTTLPVNVALLHEGDNTVTLTAAGGQTDISFVDALRVTYPHVYVADNDKLSFSVSSRAVVVSGFSTANIRVIDITNLNALRELLPKIVRTGETYGFAVQGGAGLLTVGGTRNLIALSDSLAEQPSAITRNEPSSWNASGNGANLVIITHGDFRQSVEPLAALRRTQGMTVSVVDVEDVYDEFSYGAHTPQALRDFLAWSNTHWTTAPHYVLLAGDSSWDPRNYLGQGYNDYVPTKLIDTADSETASDDWLGDIDGDGTPDLAVGRLPVRTAAEANIMVSKILSYEQERAVGGPMRGALLVADRGFESQTTDVAGLLSPSTSVQTLSRSVINDDSSMRTQIVNAINDGPAIVNYFGHGSVGIWSGNLLNSSNASTLTNSTKPSFFVMMTCLNGYAHDAYIDSLGETLLKDSQGGAFAVWASSGKTVPEGQTLIDKQLYQLLLGAQPMTLGDAIRQAKLATSDPDVRRTWILLGDPSMRLR
jgi:hypothetical protein